jgi:hypothetical protein
MIEVDGGMFSRKVQVAVHHRRDPLDALDDDLQIFLRLAAESVPGPARTYR